MLYKNFQPWLYLSLALLAGIINTPLPAVADENVNLNYYYNTPQWDVGYYNINLQPTAPLPPGAWFEVYISDNKVGAPSGPGKIVFQTDGAGGIYFISYGAGPNTRDDACCFISDQLKVTGVRRTVGSGDISASGSASFVVTRQATQSLPPQDVGNPLNIVLSPSSHVAAPADTNQTGECDANTGCSKGSPMAAYSIHLMLASLHIEDTPISYAPPRGPRVDFQVVYNQREANQPTTFNYSNLGPKWTFNWLSYVTDNPADPTIGATVYQRGGGTESYTGWNSGTSSYAPDAQSMAVLVKTSSTTYERRMPDGSKQIFSVVSGSVYPRRIFMTQEVDPAGNAVVLTYDTTLRVTKITDPLGQITTLAYTLSGDSLKITSVTDPFKRVATFTYTSGKLTKITDPVGIQSQFVYQTGSDFINTLTTPYGTTTFAKGENGNTLRWLEATDPLGGKERVEYNDSVNGIWSAEASAPAGVFNDQLNFANTFYWDKKAMADAPGDYTKARQIHWLTSANGTQVSGIKHSEKKALENRVWYVYAGQANDGKVGTNALPMQIARVLDDGTTQLSQFEYNTLGNLTKETDPAGRVFSYVYAANGIDLLEKRQTRGGNNELLASFIYNGIHLPLTATDAAGEITTYTYNSYGQVLTVKNAKNETTTYVYDRDQNNDGKKDGYLLTATGPVAGATTTLTYDTSKRIATVTDSDLYKLTYTYDNIDRPLTIKYPDNTTEAFTYTDNVTGVMRLDLAKSKDRRGRLTLRYYDGNRQLTKVTDPLSRSTIFNWCTCGSLASITDAKNNVTTFVRDVQGRVTSKVFMDTSAIHYTYENTTSRLESMTDAKNQVTSYFYNPDDTVSQTFYTDVNGQPLNPPTPSVSYTYDPNYKRVATMTDGTGLTTYAYYPITGTVNPGAGQLQSVTGPLANSTITYSYDQLGRELSEAVNGVSASQVYDPLGRVTSITNPLGTFTNTYVANSPRLQTTAYPNTQVTSYVYFANTGDKRLQTLQNKTSAGANISKFDYTYDADGEILSWNRQFGTANAIRWANGTSSMGDLADQLTTVSETDAVTKAVRTSYTYAYDPAGNRTSDKTGAYSINNLNQITNSGYAYDANGNLTADVGRTYEWDAADRLVAINFAAIGGRTEFIYDGLGRRVRITERGSGMTVTLDPADTLYQLFTSAPFSLGGGNYTLTFQGLSSNYVAFIDDIRLNGTLVPNGGFETPTLNANEIRSQPSGATWNFVTVNAGMVRDTPFGNPSAPEGSQAGYVLGQASIYQTATASAGSFTLSLKAAQGGGNGGIHQQIQLTIQSDPFVPPVIKNFIWSGNSIVEERDANNVVTKRFYPQGVQLTQPSTVNLFYDRDHLGSIRELTDSTQAVRARYDYDPYGVRTKLSGDLDADFAYTGHYFHQPSGLNLAPYRGYSASTGKWIGRDPIGENGGINLYAYVENNPSNAFDPLGFDSWYDVAADWFFERGAAGGTRNHPQLYGASHQITRDLMNDPGVQEAREAWNAKGRPNCFSYDYAFGVTDYLHDLFTLNGTGSFLGSYHVAINRCTNGSTRLEVTNTTGWESGTRSAIPGSRANSSLEDMLKGSGFTLNPRSILNDRMRSAPGPGGNFYQLYYWKE